MAAGNATIVKEELDKLGAFSGKLNKYAMYMANSLDKEIPLSMRLNISNFSLASFISHFHTKIVLDDSFIPTNFVGFTLAQSGSAKTSSVNGLERALGRGYDVIEQARKEKQEIRAKEIAEANDEENWLKYVKPLNPLSNSLSTEAGMIKKLNSFAEEGVGLPSLFIDEIGTELACSPDIVPNIKLVSELFDAGNKKSRALATEENERAEVSGMGMSAMFIGSEHNVLLDESIMKKFNSEFVTKLARRCFFNFPEFEFKEETYDSIESILNSADSQKEFQVANSLEIRDMAYNVAEKLIHNDINNVMIDVDADRLYKIYKFHCKYQSQEHTEEAILLEQLHRHWKVLKLAGVYAVADERNSISTDDLIEAISFAELIDGELAKFIELSKREHYEILIDLLRVDDRLSLHELRKKEIITGGGKAESKAVSLIELANSKLSGEGMLKFEDGNVFLELFKKEIMKASYKLVSGTKEERAYNVHDGFISKETSFQKLSSLLSNDTAYTPCVFKEGKRSNDNTIGGIGFIVLDIDNSDITYTEAHDMLSDFNHHIAKTSNNENPYKFRVLLELDITLEINNMLWKSLMESVKRYTGLDIDILAYSQIYFGYKDREVLSIIDADKFPISSLLPDLSKEIKTVKKLPTSKINDAFDDRFNIFEYAYEAAGDTRSAFLYRAMKHCFDLGFSKEQTFSLVEDIIEYHGNNVQSIYKRTGLNRQIERVYSK